MTAAFSTLISVQDFVAHAEDDWQVFDCRFDLAEPAAGEEAWQTGHIPGANYAHLERDMSGDPARGGGRHPLPDRDTFIERLRSWHVGEDTQVVCYDDTGGMYAARFWWLARWAGHVRVAVLDGGWQAWRAEGDGKGVSDRYLAEVEYLDRGVLTRVVDMSDVQDTVAGNTPRTLLDARQAMRFRGEIEPIDPKAGHIPGAINVPFEGNLAPEGTFLSAEALRDRFDTFLSSEGRKPVTCYCGSGVTATHNILAMVHAGMDEPALYPGSFSEWCSLDENEVATGD